MGDARQPLNEIVQSLTEKQVETMRALAHGAPAKQIARDLGISESAVVQRIETLRRKFGGPPRHELARLARELFPQEPGHGAYKNLAAKDFHLPASDVDPQTADGSATDGDGERSEADRSVSLVPRVLDGENAGLARWFFAFGIAVLTVILMLLLFALGMAFNQLR